MKTERHAQPTTNFFFEISNFNEKNLTSEEIEKGTEENHQIKKLIQYTDSKLQCC